MRQLVETVESHGGDPRSLVDFSREGPTQLPYATILAGNQAARGDAAAMLAVYEWQGRPLVLLVDGASVREDRHRLARIRRVAAMRGDAPYIGVVDPGQMKIYRVQLKKGLEELKPLSDSVLPSSRDALIPWLANARPGLKQHMNLINKVVLSLLGQAIDELIGQGVRRSDAISLVGRALFIRFLADRNLLPSVLFEASAAARESLFDTTVSARRASQWLEDTFNGDFLPLSGACFDELADDSYRALGNILHRAPGGQLSLDWQEDWAHLDFSHIPVGVLSQAYEHYLGKHEADKQKIEGGFYTPRHIVDVMTRASFDALRRHGISHSARVLDPAAGAGVFLIDAFRQLVAENWRRSGVRPDTAKLRKILYEQITGFDINEAALRFAALGLYLISIELDPHPDPVEKLSFENLRGRVLHKLGEAEIGEVSNALGSLGPEVGTEHNGRYDLVIGNPPWSTSTRLKGWASVAEGVNRVARERVPAWTAPIPLPNQVTDLPFVWRAMEWAKPGGQIAFALHARILFLRGEGMPIARAALFRCLEITSVVNGTEIRATRVWPDIEAPFCLLFARNTTPTPASGFRYINCRLDSKLNQSGAWRIDATGSEIVANFDVVEREEILKTVFRGSVLDLELIDRIRTHDLPTLALYWSELFGRESRKLKYTGNGYQRLRKSSTPRKKDARSDGEELAGVAASELHTYLEATEEAMRSVVLDRSACVPFKTARLHRTRDVALYDGPLVLVAESPRAPTLRIRPTFSEGPIVYSQSYNGYNTSHHSEPVKFGKYLSLLIGSKFTLWHSLMTSGRFGFEREVIEKFIIEELPIVPFERLSADQLENMESLFDALSLKPSDVAWQAVDDWVVTLYGLEKEDADTIASTLEYNLPFSACQEAADTPPKPEVFASFCDVLREEMRIFAQHIRKTIDIVPAESPRSSPWRFIHVRVDHADPTGSEPTSADYWAALLRIADERGDTEVTIVDHDERCFWIGRPNQGRYWSRNAAILTARHLVFEHLDDIAGDDRASA